ncbi:c-type cytochrome [Rhodoplanes azumiensis]|uniref:C-type cytochrome n=1 Tax=Rhodoplanes azumiensis TaxID=1897628 RepID=A0ABW5AM83_9BRAD
MEIRSIMAAIAASAALVAATTAAPAQEAPKAFAQCKACHKVEAGKNGVGPSLFGIYGSKLGQVAGFKYSDAHLKFAQQTVDEAFLTKYLADPKGTIPGNKMVFAGLKNPDDVKAVIAYLKTVK